ncbi:MAG: polysaccharide pyruvyl transferase CsaB [bacterium]|nr:polysaccharide pyruvyl transferase CsaB [bacterium]
MTKFIVSGYVGFDNFGDEAIVSVLAKYLKEQNAEKITWISSNPCKTAELYGINSVGMFNFFNALKESDVLISGGGSLLQDITSLKSLVYYVTIIALAILMNKKVIILAQGFSPFRTRIGEFLAKFVLKRCDYISVRDSGSQELLADWGIKSELVSDPVFGIEIPQTEHKGIGIQLRDFPNLTDEFLYKLADFVSEKFKNEEIKLISLQDNYDLHILEKFAKILTDKNIKSYIVKNLSVENAVKEISELKYLIGMRFHACLVGAKSSVNVLGINYDKKVEELAKGINFPIVNLTNAENEDFDKIFSINPNEYNIPQIKFPKVN